MHLSVASLCGPHCVDPVAGARVCVEVTAALQRGESVCLDFTGVKVLTSRFAVTAVGCLYASFPSMELENRLHFSGLDEVDAEFLRAVQDKARQFYAASPEVRARLVEADRQLVPNE